MGDITFVKAEKADINKVVKILNDVTSDLISKNIFQWEYPWDEELIKKDIEDEKVFLVLVEGYPIGTFSLEEVEKGNNEFYRNVNGKYLYRIAVLPRIQGLGYGKKILEVIKLQCEMLKYTLYLGCWSGNEKLKKFYTNAGVEYIGDCNGKDYSISIFKTF